jgi:hypothetical protein
VSALHRLSAVIELLDGHRGGPALGAAPRFRLNGASVAPLPKQQARYVLQGLAPGDYVLEVDTAAFQPYRANFSVRADGVTPAGALAERWLPCRLEPGAHYTYPAHATVLRGRISGAAKGEIAVSADYCSVHGRQRSVHTQCTSGEAYTLVLPGQLADPTAVTLRFTVAGGSREQQIEVRPGRLQRVESVF